MLKIFFKSWITALFFLFFVKDSLAVKIVTIFDESDVLSKKAEEIFFTEGLEQPRTIADQLIEALRPFMPAAGLAAPQIDISKQIFIFSWNRTEEALEVVINPKILVESSETSISWEACFSTVQDEGESRAAFVSRPNTIDVEYFTLEGQVVRKRLAGFAARVFLHEFDHLNGVENVNKKNAQVKSFSNKAKLFEFIQEVKSRDSAIYQEPTHIR